MPVTTKNSQVEFSSESLNHRSGYVAKSKGAPLVASKGISAVQAGILKILLVDGRKGAAEIAKEMGVTKEEVYKQFQEMKRAEIVKGATIHINYRSFGYKAVAHLLINMDPQQADQLIEYVKKMPDIYSVYSNGPKGNIRIVTTLKTLQQLDEVKEEIKGKFSIFDIKTSIWTDVKEMHSNLAIAPQNNMEAMKVGRQTEAREAGSDGVQKKNVKIDEIDVKIAEKLSENGRVSLEKMAKEIGITPSAVKRRYEKLKKNGALKVTIQVDLAKIGYQAMAVFFVTVTMKEDARTIIEKIGRIPDVISIMKTSGDYDFQIYAMIRDLDHLLTIQSEIAKIHGITKMELEIARIFNKWPTPRQYISTI